MVNNKKRRSNNKKKKKRTQSSSRNCENVTAAAKSSAASKVLTTTKEKTMVCFHGSTVEKFSDNNSYSKVIYEWMDVAVSSGPGCTVEIDRVLSKFYAKHEHLMVDNEFVRYTFAYATDLHLSNRNFMDENIKLLQKAVIGKLLFLGIRMKYFLIPVSQGTDLTHGSIHEKKYYKYMRDIQTDRGIINCLARETLPFCDCMKATKCEAKTMEKLGMCSGCSEEFPKTELRRCKGCGIVNYCSTECMKRDWSEHRHFCTSSTVCNQ